MKQQDSRSFWYVLASIAVMVVGIGMMVYTSIHTNIAIYLRFHSKSDAYTADVIGGLGLIACGLIALILSLRRRSSESLPKLIASVLLIVFGVVVSTSTPNTIKR